MAGGFLGSSFSRSLACPGVIFWRGLRVSGTYCYCRGWKKKKKKREKGLLLALTQDGEKSVYYASGSPSPSLSSRPPQCTLGEKCSKQKNWIFFDDLLLLPIIRQGKKKENLYFVLIGIFFLCAHFFLSKKGKLR